MALKLSKTGTTAARLARPETTTPVRIYWPYAINVVIVHALALLVFVPALFSWAGFGLCLAGLYVFGTLGINLCYHRMLTHRSLTVPTWLERLLATLAICSLQDSPARWVAIHRQHHQHSDTEADPHSPLVNFLWGHFAWVFIRNGDHDKTMSYERYCRDILRDPYYFWCERRLHWFWIYVGHAFLFFAVAAFVAWAITGDGWFALRTGSSILVWAVFLRTVLVWHITWSVNSMCHLFGYRNYETRDASRNNFLCALISNGDGWHNNHHAHQRCAAHGHKWWELDVTYVTIRLLERLGLATDVVHHTS